MLHIELKPVKKRFELSGSMTDISFLLIIFFIVTAVFFADKGLFLILPDKSKKPLQLKPDNVIEINLGENVIYVDGKVVNIIQLKRIVAERLNAKANLVVVLEVLSGVKYQRVLDVLAEARKGGAKDFSIVTRTKKPVPVEVEGKREE